MRLPLPPVYDEESDLPETVAKFLAERKKSYDALSPAEQWVELERRTENMLADAIIHEHEKAENNRWYGFRQSLIEECYHHHAGNDTK